jgi:hypothetical protein
MDNEPILVALTDILVGDVTWRDQIATEIINTRNDWWAWMRQEYGAERGGVTVSNRFGYSSIAVQFPNRESYVRYCLKWM